MLVKNIWDSGFNPGFSQTIVYILFMHVAEGRLHQQKVSVVKKVFVYLSLQFIATRFSQLTWPGCLPLGHCSCTQSYCPTAAWTLPCNPHAARLFTRKERMGMLIISPFTFYLLKFWSVYFTNECLKSLLLSIKQKHLWYTTMCSTDGILLTGAVNSNPSFPPISLSHSLSSVSVSSLIVLGLKHFSQTEFPHKLMSQYLIQSKRVEQLRTRVRDMSSSRATDNIIKVPHLELFPYTYMMPKWMINAWFYIV